MLTDVWVKRVIDGIHWIFVFPFSSGLVGSCIIIIVIAVFFESLKSYKGLSNKKPEKKTSESMPLLGHLHTNESR